MAGTIVANTINTDTGLYSTNNAYNGIAKAWVNFRPASSYTIQSSFNVSSITKNGTGLYTINFATALSNAGYAGVAGASDAFQQILTSGNYNRVAEVNPYSTTQCSVAIYAPNNATLVDTNYCGVVIFD
jgi:hypothetical protein